MLPVICSTVHKAKSLSCSNIIISACYMHISSCQSHLVLPLKFHPHLPELAVSTGGRLDVVHDVNVDVVEDHTVAVRGGTHGIIYCIIIYSKEIFEKDCLRIQSFNLSRFSLTDVSKDYPILS